MMKNRYLYEPLQDIIFSDDFDEGLNGWVVLTPNFRQDAMDYFPSYKYLADWQPPMLSSATFPYLGTHGSMHGTYSMKIGTRAKAAPANMQPIAGSIGHAIKRLTFLKRQLLKCELWFTFKAEQDRPGIGENDLRAFGFFWDIQDEDCRYFCGVRYLNAANGQMKQKWQLMSAEYGTDLEWVSSGESAPGESTLPGSHTPVFIKRGIDAQWFGTRDQEGGSNGFVDVPGGTQPLCFNESADKINWHYLALTVDLEKRCYVELRCANRVFDIQTVRPTLVDRYPRINQLLNPVLWVESDTDRRVFLFVDSIVNSTGPSRQGAQA